MLSGNRSERRCTGQNIDEGSRFTDVAHPGPLLTSPKRFKSRRSTSDPKGGGVPLSWQFLTSLMLGVTAGCPEIRLAARGLRTSISNVVADPFQDVAQRSRAAVQVFVFIKVT